MKLKMRVSSNHWKPPENIKNQCHGAEWSRKSNLSFFGILDLGGSK